jgi:hypothetical protein
MLQAGHQEGIVFLPLPPRLDPPELRARAVRADACRGRELAPGQGELLPELEPFGAALDDPELPPLLHRSFLSGNIISSMAL